jgi:hypothetical protein
VRYEILSPTTGQSMTLQYADWLRLLGLASRYGGIPDESLYHYYDGNGVAIPEDVAGDMAEALAGAERDLLALVQGGTLPGDACRLKGTTLRTTRRRFWKARSRACWRTSRARGSGSSQSSSGWDVPANWR